MILFSQRVRAVALAAALLAASAATLTAQTVVTTAAPNGWFFYDGAGPGTDPSQITGTQPFGGNGSLQFTISASNQQPSAGYFFGAPVALSSLNSLDLGYSWLVPTGTVPAASPTIRLLLTGLSNAGQSGRSDGSLGWYSNGVNDTWDSGSFDLNTGDFFFRVGGVGEAANDCASAGSTFDDRRQDIATWISTCNGAGNVFDIDNASIIGVQVDWGTFVAPGSAASFADAVNFSIGSNDGSFNFEQPGGNTQSVTPEPATMSLMALGLVGLVGVRRRKRTS